MKKVGPADYFCVSHGARFGDLLPSRQSLSAATEGLSGYGSPVTYGVGLRPVGPVDPGRSASPTSFLLRRLRNGEGQLARGPSGPALQQPMPRGEDDQDTTATPPVRVYEAASFRCRYTAAGP